MNPRHRNIRTVPCGRAGECLPCRLHKRCLPLPRPLLGPTPSHTPVVSLRRTSNFALSSLLRPRLLLTHSLPPLVLITPYRRQPQPAFLLPAPLALAYLQYLLYQPEGTRECGARVLAPLRLPFSQKILEQGMLAVEELIPVDGGARGAGSGSSAGQEGKVQCSR